jgi:hypothetical protein
MVSIASVLSGCGSERDGRGAVLADEGAGDESVEAERLSLRSIAYALPSRAKSTAPLA